MLALIAWSPGAVACYEAIRGRVLHDGNIYLSDLVSALALDTSPTESVLGRVLRDTAIWPSASSLLRAAPRSAGYHESNPNLAISLDSFENFSGFAVAVERLARLDRSHQVGERHIAQRLVELHRPNKSGFAFLGLNADRVYEEVRKLEIGLDLSPDELNGWHGLIDTNIILKWPKSFWDIDWRKATGVRLDFAYNIITIWLSTVLLHELDAIPTYHRDPDIKRKAAAFTSWLNTQLRTPKDVDLLPLAERVRIKFWRQPVSDVAADSQHLEAARNLRDCGIAVKLVTHDSEMRVRALAEGFDIFDLIESEEKA